GKKEDEKLKVEYDKSGDKTKQSDNVSKTGGVEREAGKVENADESELVGEDNEKAGNLHDGSDDSKRRSLQRQSNVQEVIELESSPSRRRESSKHVDFNESLNSLDSIENDRLNSSAMNNDDKKASEAN